MIFCKHFIHRISSMISNYIPKLVCRPVFYSRYNYYRYFQFSSCSLAKNQIDIFMGRRWRKSVGCLGRFVLLLWGFRGFFENDIDGHFFDVRNKTPYLWLLDLDWLKHWVPLGVIGVSLISLECFKDLSQKSIYTMFVILNSRNITKTVLSKHCWKVLWHIDR